MDKKNNNVNEPKMGLILTGDPETGKSLLANFIGEIIPEQVLKFDSRSLRTFGDPFLFSRLDSTCKLIVFEEVRKIEVIYRILDLITNGIYVNARGKHPIILDCPYVIIIVDGLNIIDFHPRICKAFKVVELKRTGFPKFQKQIAS